MNKVKPVFSTEIISIPHLSSGQMIRVFSVVSPDNGKIDQINIDEA